MENAMTDFAALETLIKYNSAMNTMWTGVAALATLRLLSQAEKAAKAVQ